MSKGTSAPCFFFHLPPILYSYPLSTSPNELTNSPHMKRLYDDSLRKDAGRTRVLKTITRKHAQVLDKHVPELTEVAQDLKKRLEIVYVKRRSHSRISWRVVSAIPLFLRREVLTSVQRDPRSGSWCWIRPRLSRGGGTRSCIRACSPYCLLEMV